MTSGLLDSSLLSTPTRPSGFPVLTPGHSQVPLPDTQGPLFTPQKDTFPERSFPRGHTARAPGRCSRWEQVTSRVPSACVSWAALSLPGPCGARVHVRWLERRSFSAASLSSPILSLFSRTGPPRHGGESPSAVNAPLLRERGLLREYKPLVGGDFLVQTVKSLFLSREVVSARREDTLPPPSAGGPFNSCPTAHLVSLRPVHWCCGVGSKEHVI